MNDVEKMDVKLSGTFACQEAVENKFLKLYSEGSLEERTLPMLWQGGESRPISIHLVNLCNANPIPWSCACSSECKFFIVLMGTSSEQKKVKKKSPGVKVL